MISDNKSILTGRIENVILDMIYNTGEFPKVNYSVYLSEKLELDYTYLSNVFSDTKKITIEHYIIFHKIEKAKQLLTDRYNISEIALILNYKDIAHFSGQFKKITGHTPSFFKAMIKKFTQILHSASCNSK